MHSTIHYLDKDQTLPAVAALHKRSEELTILINILCTQASIEDDKIGNKSKRPMGTRQAWSATTDSKRRFEFIKTSHFEF